LVDHDKQGLKSINTTIFCSIICCFIRPVKKTAQTLVCRTVLIPPLLADGGRRVFFSENEYD